MAKKKKEDLIKENYNDYIIAVDSSLNDTGVAVYSLSKKEVVYTGHCQTDSVRNIKKYDGYNINAFKLRIHLEYFENIKKKFPPKLVVIEKGFAKFRKEVEALNQVRGVIYSVFWNYTQIEYAPTAVKAEILFGKATKEELRDVIITNYPELAEDKLFYNNDNVSDAVAVLFTYLLKNKFILKTNWDRKKYDKKTPKKKTYVKKPAPPF